MHPVRGYEQKDPASFCFYAVVIHGGEGDKCRKNPEYPRPNTDTCQQQRHDEKKTNIVKGAPGQSETKNKDLQWTFSSPAIVQDKGRLKNHVNKSVSK